MNKSINICLYIIIVNFLTWSFCFAALVDGYCYLENQTIHDSIKVFFQADSPGAVTDSTYTNSEGYYFLNLQTGVYNITYSHQWYVSYSLLDQYISVNTTLPPMTLQYGVLLSGFISGVLESGLYLVVGNVGVDTDDSLFIEPGVILLFTGPYDIITDGFFSAIGTENDSIFFIADTGEYWLGYLQSLNSVSYLKYCHFEGTETYAGLIINNGSAVVENCLIVGNNGGIGTTYDAQAIINNCVISQNFRTSGGGFRGFEDANFTFNNCIFDCNSATSSGGAAYYYDDAVVQFNNCIFNNNGPNGGILASGNSQSTFTNCVIDSNWDTASDGYGIKCLNNASVTLVNTIVTGNSYYGINFAGGGTHSITYSDFYRNRNGDFGGSVPPFLGQLVTTNLNEDSCDIYYNIYQPPEFVDPVNGNYNLQAISPCIDAGDPDSPLDPDSTIADIGAFYFDQTLPMIEDLVISIVGDDVILNWSEIPSAVSYNIYRSTVAYFAISSLNLLANTTNNQFTDQNAVLTGNYFYIITAIAE